MSRIIANKKKIRNNFILKVSLTIFTIIVFFYWLFNNNLSVNFFFNYIELLSDKYNYVLNEVEIEGLSNVSEDEINQYFIKYYNKSIFLLPIKRISKKIEENKWINSVTLKSNFKNKISINLNELEPAAVYFNGKNYVLISKSGKAIDFASNKEIEQFIIVKGEHAKVSAPNLLNVIPLNLKSIIKTIEYINNRRWDIYSINGLKIKLPADNYKKAMENFIDIYNNLSSSDISKIKFIDLRIPGRAIIKFYNKKE